MILRSNPPTSAADFAEKYVNHKFSDLTAGAAGTDEVQACIAKAQAVAMRQGTECKYCKVIPPKTIEDAFVGRCSTIFSAGISPFEAVGVINAQGGTLVMVDKDGYKLSVRAFYTDDFAKAKEAVTSLHRSGQTCSTVLVEAREDEPVKFHALSAQRVDDDVIWAMDYGRGESIEVPEEQFVRLMIYDTVAKKKDSETELDVRNKAYQKAMKQVEDVLCEKVPSVTIDHGHHAGFEAAAHTVMTSEEVLHQARKLMKEAEREREEQQRADEATKELAAHAADDEALVRRLLADRASVNQRCLSANQTPLHKAVCAAHAAMARALIEARAEVGARGPSDFTPLHEAAQRGHAGMAQTLIEAGAEVAAKNANGLTPLHLAATRGHVDAARVIIEARANLEATGVGNGTPLHWAAGNNKDGTVRILIEARADIEAKDKLGRAPIDCATADVVKEAFGVQSSSAMMDAAQQLLDRAAEEAQKFLSCGCGERPIDRRSGQG